MVFEGGVLKAQKDGTMAEATMTTNKPFGDLLEAARMRKGLTQREVAKNVGLHREQLTQWEAGQLYYTPRAEVLNPLAAFLEIPVVEMLQTLGYDLGLSQ